MRVDYTFSARGPSGGIGSADWTVGATLVGGNRVIDSFEGRGRSGRSAGGGEERLGGGRWRVAGSNELVRVTDWPNSQTIIRVTVTGQTCHATVESRLKPGKTTYLFRRTGGGGTIEMTDPTYSNIRCSIE